MAVRNRIYIEITNRCNLACDFCHGTKRPLGTMTPENFHRIAEKLQGQTNYLYFHVLGEPLLHPQLGELLDMAGRLGFRVTQSMSLPFSMRKYLRANSPST